jgi:hypothetical protein
MPVLIYGQNNHVTDFIFIVFDFPACNAVSAGRVELAGQVAFEKTWVFHIFEHVKAIKQGL